MPSPKSKMGKPSGIVWEIWGGGTAKGRLWFCGRKNHRVVTAEKTLYTIPCEAIFNNHPAVYRSALVGIGQPHCRRAAICIELEPDHKRQDREILRQELLELGRGNILTEDIEIILFHKKFPVDVRHNSKIFREKLSDWAQRQAGVISPLQQQADLKSTLLGWSWHKQKRHW